MKKAILVLGFAIVALSSCKKEEIVNTQLCEEIEAEMTSTSNAIQDWQDTYFVTPSDRADSEYYFADGYYEEYDDVMCFDEATQTYVYCHPKYSMKPEYQQIKDSMQNRYSTLKKERYNNNCN